MKHVPGKSLWTADALSCKPVKTELKSDDAELLEDTNIYVDMLRNNLPR